LFPKGVVDPSPLSFPNFSVYCELVCMVLKEFVCNDFRSSDFHDVSEPFADKGLELLRVCFCYFPCF